MVERKKMSFLWSIIIVLIIILIDQSFKIYIKLNYSISSFNQPYIIDWGFFKLLFIENSGMAMGVKLNDFMEFYESIYDTMISEMPRRSNEQMPFNNPGKFLGMIIMHFKEDNDDMELDEKVNMWVNILNIDRSSENFMKGTGSLWYNFTPANQKNQEQENIRARLDRIKEFYEDKDSISDEFNVEYVENDPE